MPKSSCHANTDTFSDNDDGPCFLLARQVVALATAGYRFQSRVLPSSFSRVVCASQCSGTTAVCSLLDPQRSGVDYFCRHRGDRLAASHSDDCRRNSRRLLQRAFRTEAAASLGEGVCHFGRNCHDDLLFHPSVLLRSLAERFERIDCSSYRNSFWYSPRWHVHRCNQS